MEDQNTKIATLNLIISENCSETEKEIINYYWMRNDLNFVKTVKSICESFEITQNLLNKLISTNSELLIYFSCGICNENYSKQVNSRKNFKLLRDEVALSYYALNKCDTCLKNEQNLVDRQNLEKQKKVSQKLEKAIENKNWNNLTKFEREVLIGCLEMSFVPLKKKYGGQSGKESFIKLIRALEKIASQDLIQLIRNIRDNYITDYKYLTKLAEFKEEIKVPIKTMTSYVQTHVDTNELKFKLTINENQYHLDSPLHAGTVTFKERIVIEPGVEYIFGLWNRANENLYLTMTPLENLKKIPQTKRISRQPISLQQGITDFLNRLGKDF